MSNHGKSMQMNYQPWSESEFLKILLESYSTVQHVFSRDNVDTLWNYLEKLMKKLNIQLNDQATVAMAYDTRASSVLLSSILKRAAEIFHADVKNYGKLE